MAATRVDGNDFTPLILKRRENCVIKTSTRITVLAVIS